MPSLLANFVSMNRRFSFACTAVALLLLFGFGCKGLSEDEQASVRGVSIDYWTVFNDVDQLRAFAAAYTATKPHIRINIRQVRYEEFEQQFLNALADDVSPDIISVHAKDIGKYQPRLSPMPRTVQVANVFIKGKYVKETVVQPEVNTLPSLSVIRQQYMGTVAADVIRGGSVYGLPLALDTLALYYDKDLLDKAGVATPPATWEEFLAAVKASTKYDSTDNVIQAGVALGTGNNIDNAPDLLAMLMMQNGLRVAEDGIVTITAGAEQGIQTAPAIEALRFYTDFARPTKEVYSWHTNMENAFDAFVRGQSVFFIGYAHDFPRIRARAPQKNVAIVALPQLNTNGPANVANYWVESVVKKSTDQDVAWDFIRFMSSPENIKTYTDATKQPSPLRIHVNTQLEDPVLEPFVSQILTARNWYSGTNAAVAEEVLTDLIEEYRLPYPEDIKPDKRDADLLTRAARRMQQTM